MREADAMVRALLVLTLLAGLALPATASAAGYTLADDGATIPNLLVGPGDQSAVAIKYTSVCLLIGCNNGVTISSADDATPINNMSGLCNQITASSYRCDVAFDAHT